GVHDDFFELGGNSLLATRLLSKLQDDGLHNVSLEQLFTYKTIAAISQKITEQPTPAAQATIIEPGCGKGLTATTPMQQKLWMFSQFEKGQTAYHIPLIIEVNGNFDKAVFQSVLKDIIARHDILRTTYHAEQGQLQLRLLEHYDLPFKEVDLSGHDELSVHKSVNEEVQRPFNLQQDCMLRACLFCLTESRQILLLTQHHIASDGWSVGVLAKEIKSLYTAKVSGETVALPELTVQYQDYAHWYHSFRESQAFELQLDYWRTYLNHAPQLHNLPLDNPRSNERHFSCGRLIQTIPAELTARLNAFNIENNLTMFMLLQGMLALVLCRWSDSRDIVMGTPVANRHNAQLEPLIGSFINTLVLRNQIDDTQTFLDYITQCRQNHLKGFDNQQVPYELLLDQLGVIKTNQYNPLYQILFAMQNNERPDIELPDVELTLLEPQLLESVFDLELNAYEVNGEIQIEWDYNDAIFHSSTIENIISSFESALEYAVKQSDTLLKDIPVSRLTIPEALLKNFVSAEESQHRDVPIIGRILESAQNNPDKLAVETGNGELTYKELVGKASALASVMQKNGVEEGSYVAIYINRETDLVVALLGVMLSGAAFLPLDPSHPFDRVRSILEQVPVSVLLSTSTLNGSLEQVDCPVISIDTLSTEAQQSFQYTAAKPSDSAYILFTSGSTGKPKGVEISNNALSEMMTSFIDHINLAESCRWLALSTITFDISLLEIFAPLCVGGHVILAQDHEVKDGFRLKRMLDEFNINIMQATPATYKMLMLANWSGKSDLVAISGGEALSLTLADDMRGKCQALWNAYGPTEATIWCLVKQVDFAAEPDKILSLGGVLANSGYVILDDNMQIVPPGVTGQLFIAGEFLAKGYWQRPTLTAQKFVDVQLADAAQTRLYASGDLVRQRRDGDLDYLGRIDHQVKVRGHRIELGEIDVCCASIEVVKESCSVVIEEGDDSYIVTYVIFSHSLETVDTVRQHLFNRLPAYMLPAAVVPLDEWPLTANGKIDRKALPKPDFSQLTVPMVEPDSEIEWLVYNCCQELLQIEEISLAANFFELGGNSLTATHFVALINEQLSLQINIKDFVEKPTLGSLAAYLEGRVDTTARVNSLMVSDSDMDEELEEFEL
ncbi:non-ribosomal peptide synthetase, partial [Pseudoalteromonas piscicida]